MDKIIYKIYKIIYHNEIIYIGQTKMSIERRFSCRHPNIPKDIKKESYIELIEETNDISRERYWIDYYRSIGCNLYNIERGGGFNIKEYSKYYYKENIENIIERARKYREYNKEYYKEHNKIYYSENKDKEKERLKKYREDNNEKLKEYYKKYNKLRKKKNK